MDGLIGQSDGPIRLAVFASVFLVMALIELLWPKRKLIVSKRKRWLTNIGISAAGTALLRLMAMLAVPVAAIAAALYAQAHQIGLLNQVGWPQWIKVVVALLALDLAIWAQHLVSHKIPIFWRLHQVHHADRDIDVTTAVRFHPVEIGLSMLWKIAVVVPLGASPLAVFLFEVILNACAMFNHANIALPAWFDRMLRLYRRHARHASGASLGAAARARFKLRLQPVALGSAVPHLHGAAASRASRHDHRAQPLSERGADAVRLVAVAAVRAAAT